MAITKKGGYDPPLPASNPVPPSQRVEPPPPPKTPPAGLNMFCVLDRPKGRGDWNYFNLYPDEKMAKRTADTITGYKDSNREAVVVPVFVPFPS